MGVGGGWGRGGTVYQATSWTNWFVLVALRVPSGRKKEERDENSSGAEELDQNRTNRERERKTTTTTNKQKQQQRDKQAPEQEKQLSNTGSSEARTKITKRTSSSKMNEENASNIAQTKPKLTQEKLYFWTTCVQYEHAM